MPFGNKDFCQNHMKKRQFHKDFDQNFPKNRISHALNSKIPSNFVNLARIYPNKHYFEFFLDSYRPKIGKSSIFHKDLPIFIRNIYYKACHGPLKVHFDWKSQTLSCSKNCNFKKNDLKTYSLSYFHEFSPTIKF